MTCDRALLSAYVDNELELSQKTDLENHLELCRECASHLEMLRAMRMELRDIPRMHAPSQLGTQLAERIQQKKRVSARWLPIAIGAPVGVIAMVAGATLLAPRFEAPAPLVVTATAPAMGAQRVALNGPIELWFDREIQKQALPVVTIDPPAQVQLSVDGNALRIDPMGDLSPGQTYTIAVSSVTDVDGRKLKTPAVVSFTTATTSVATLPAELGSPRGDVKESAESARQIPKWASIRRAVPDRGSEPQVAVQPLADALGALTSPAQRIQVVEQAFQGGMMIKVGSSAQTLVLQRSRNNWESYADPARLSDLQAMSDTSLPPPPGALAPAGIFGRLWNSSSDLRTRLGWAVYELRLSDAVVEQHERGTAVVLGHMAYLLQSDGHWSVLSIAK